MGMLDKEALINRRSFLKATGCCAGAMAMASAVPEIAYASAPSPKNLLVIYCDGGYDGLNMITPYTDPAYYQQRGAFAIPQSAVLDIDGQFGLHPRMGAMKQLMDSGELTAFHAVELSDHRIYGGNHFSSAYEIFHGGSTQNTGFMNRLTAEIDGSRSTPGAVSLTESASFFPEILAGPALTASMRPAIPPQSDQAIIDRIKLIYGASNPYAQMLQQGVNAETSLRNSLSGHSQLVNDPILNNCWAYLPQIAQVAGLLFRGSDPNSRINMMFTRAGGFDLHGSPFDVGASQFYFLSEALMAFRNAMIGDGTQPNLWQDTLVIVFSEFGRSTTLNTSDPALVGAGGTDHGHAAPMFIASGNPALINNVKLATLWPGLTNMGFNNGLRATVDGFAILRAYLRAHYNISQAAAERIFPRRQLDLTPVSGGGQNATNLLNLVGNA